jgi:hypothetical protein
LFVAQITQSPSALEAQMVSNRFWHIVSVVKEQLASLSRRVASYEPIKITTYTVSVNMLLRTIFVFHIFQQSVLGEAVATAARK